MSKQLKVYTEAGFALEQTGGGCTAYVRNLSNGQQILITGEHGPEAPRTENEKVLCGLYGKDHSEALAEVLADSASEAVEQMRQQWGLN